MTYRFAVISCVFGIALTAQGCKGEAEANSLTKAVPPQVHASVEAVASQPMPRELTLTGSLMANQQADVAANAMGLVVKTYVERGSYVKEGTPLVQLDIKGAAFSQAEARANLETAHAQRELAAAQCQRNQELFSKGAISKDEWDRINSTCRTSESSAAAAQARAELAGKTVSDSTIRAPFSGMVGERFVSVGEYVQASTKVASLVELKPLRLQITVPEADLSAVRQGQAVRFDVQSYPGETFTGEVLYIGPSVRSASRDLLVEAKVPNLDGKLRPGMFATSHLKLPDETLPVVPKTALRFEDTTTHIFVVVNGRIQERIVQTGVEKDGLVAITDGLRAGDTIVKELTADIKDGSVVN